MPPSNASHNRTDCSWRNPKFVGKFSCIPYLMPQFSYFYNFQLAKFSVRMLRATKKRFISSSPFFLRILHIIVLCSDKKMIWINARRIITLMADKFSFRDWPICLLVINTMGKFFYNTSINKAVSCTALATLPAPTSGNRIKKTFNGTLSVMSSKTWFWFATNPISIWSIHCSNTGFLSAAALTRTYGNYWCFNWGNR